MCICARSDLTSNSYCLGSSIVIDASATIWNTSQHIATPCNTLQAVCYVYYCRDDDPSWSIFTHLMDMKVCCSVLQCVAACCSVSQSSTVCHMCAVTHSWFIVFIVTKLLKLQVGGRRSMYMCDMTHPYVVCDVIVWRDVSICYVWHDSLADVQFGRQRSYTCDVTHFVMTWLHDVTHSCGACDVHMRRDCMPWLTHIVCVTWLRDSTCNLEDEETISVTWLILLWRDCVMWRIHAVRVLWLCDVTACHDSLILYVWHDSETRRAIWKMGIQHVW